MIMAKFIELHGLYNTDDIDYEALGISHSTAKENAKPLKTFVNIDNITEINDAEGGGTTIEFVSGERYLFEDSYEDVKIKILG